MSVSAVSNTSHQDLLLALNPESVATGIDNGAKSVEQMGSEDFLALMVAQLENQDPTKPMDNMAMMNQLAQFGTVGGIQDLNEAFGAMTSTLTGSQAMQASSMVGRFVASDTNVGVLRQTGVDEETEEPILGMQASAEMGDGSQGGVFYIQNLEGELLYSGAIPAGGGTQLIQWDGLNKEGEQLDPGAYRVFAESFYGGEAKPVSVYAHEQVQSVSVGSDSEVTLNLANGRALGVSDVKEFF